MDRCASRLPLLLVSASLLLAYSGHVAGSGMLRIRGIPVSKAPLYRPDQDFECLDGSLLIPFTHVNDEYCDCADGSDEPGTAACANGVFYCENAGHKPAYIPSAWVNDGVCDCCDTSDEYAPRSGGRAQCTNNCNELGREARLEQQKAEKLARDGNKLRLDLAAKGKVVVAENQARLVKLRADYEEAELTKKEKEMLKTQAEERESSALERYKPVESEQPAEAEGEEHEEDELKEAESYFNLLDSDSSGTVAYTELQTRATFDKNRDGLVSEDEALYFLDNREEVTLQEFTDSTWANIKPFLMMERGMFKATEKEEVEAEAPSNEEIPHGDEDIDASNKDLEHEGDIVEGDETDVEGDEEEGIAEEETSQHEKEADEPTVQYDEETQALIDEATSARERFQEAEKAVSELQSEIRQLEEKLDRDYGLEKEFAPLDGECFEYTDLEYIYKLCLYDKATQRSKSGGTDVSLGHWHSWVGPAGNKYIKMKYDRGITCWNGPARSTIVTLLCGTEDKLTSVTEPSRCEYAMEFTTPALCNPNVEITDTHDEL